MLEEARSPLAWQARAAFRAVLGDLARPAWQLCKHSLRAAARPAAACRRAGRCALRAPAEPWARCPFLDYLRGGVHCVQSVGHPGLGALTHLADSILFSLPPLHVPPSFASRSPSAQLRVLIGHPSMPCLHKYEVPVPGSLRRHTEVHQTRRHRFYPPSHPATSEFRFAEPQRTLLRATAARPAALLQTLWLAQGRHLHLKRLNLTASLSIFLSEVPPALYLSTTATGSVGLSFSNRQDFRTQQHLQNTSPLSVPAPPRVPRVSCCYELPC